MKFGISVPLVVITYIRQNNRRNLWTALGFTILLGASPVQAAQCFVNGGVGGIGVPPTTCGEVSVGGEVFRSPVVGTVIAPNFNNGGGGGTASAVGAGSDVTGSATASAQLGLLRVTADSTYGSPDINGFMHARSTATFSDQGTVNSVSLVTGTLVNATATVNIDGVSTGVTAGLLHSKLIISSNLRNTFINADFPNGTYNFSLQIGEILTVFLGLEVFADSGKSYPYAHADYGHSAKFFLDFADERVTFDSLGQHDYRTNVALPSETPLPAALPLFASGIGAMGLLGWYRKRKNAAAATV